MSSNENFGSSSTNPAITKMSDLSPVTNLALNLKNLSTSLQDTPCRFLSWSNPFQNESCLQAFAESVSVDSPTFQSIPLKAKQINESEENDPCLLSKQGSQDSGYSGSSLDSTPQPPKSAWIFNEKENGFESMFHTHAGDRERGIPNMTNLLTKPLNKSSKSKQMPEKCPRKGRLSIRRCLSIEMEKSCLSEPVECDIFETLPLHNCVNPDYFQKCPFKRPDTSNSAAAQNKRRKSSPLVQISENMGNAPYLQRCYSETAATIMHAVQQSHQDPGLIGDCSKGFALPLVKGRHQDLKGISGETLVHVLRGEYHHKIESFTLVDCRYPYEFVAGHIQGAINVFTKEALEEVFLNPSLPSFPRRNIIIFHCEFSSERAPSLCRFLRNKDRELNESNYPNLFHPEIYLLEGGYQAFFERFKEFCEPQGYKPMNHKDHSLELRHFRAKSKSWGADSKPRLRLH